MSELLVLSAADVAACLPMDRCIEAMRGALVAASTGEVYNPLRMPLMPPFPSPGLLGLMPAVRGGDSMLYGLKEVCVFPGNHQLGIDSHQGSVLLHDGRTGELRAILNGSLVTSIRTAAVSAVATAALARPDSRVLALVGAGIQAGRHLESLAMTMAFDEIRVVGRSPESADRFAERWTDLADVRPCRSVKAAVEGADVVVTVTNSAEPVLDRAWIADGVHINAVGSSVKSKRELDSATVAAASLFVDRRESTLNESGDFLIAAAELGLGPDHIRAEIGELLAGAATGRAGDGEITLFKSLGLAVEDLVAAELAVTVADELGFGTRLEF